MKRDRPARGPIASAVVGLGISLAVTGAGTAAEIRLVDAYPLKGRPTVIEVLAEGTPVPRATVQVLYRPNSEASSLHDLGLTDASGRVPWVPTDAGLARITARPPSDDGGDGELLAHDVAIRWGRMPTAGLVIFLVATVLLFGGAGLGFRLLVREPPPPST